MTDIVPAKRGRKPGGFNAVGTFRRTNVFKQLMYAKNDLALQLVESCQDRWEDITGILMGKALEGDMRAMALLLDYVIEKSPQKFQISTSGPDIENLSLDDMMKLVVTYDSMMKEKERTIMGEAEEIESHPINSPPPPSEIEAGIEPGISQTKTLNDVEDATLAVRMHGDPEEESVPE